MFACLSTWLFVDVVSFCFDRGNKWNKQTKLMRGLLFNKKAIKDQMNDTFDTRYCCWWQKRLCMVAKRYSINAYSCFFVVFNRKMKTKKSQQYGLLCLSCRSSGINIH